MPTKKPASAEEPANRGHPAWALKGRFVKYVHGGYILDDGNSFPNEPHYVIRDGEFVQENA